jgi:serine/threonine-protein kinase
VLKPGTKVGDYRILRKLGEGGMGEVYLAVHETLRQRVVLKGLHPQYLSDATVRERLKREAEAMARLAHPNIVALYNFLETDEGAFIVMEYVDGATFEELLHRYGPAPVWRAIELLRPVLAAIEYAHARGVIHRDLKPANIMLGSDGFVRVMDFGTAKIVDRPGLTRIGMTLGTATYMPPEQIMGEPLVPATDVYALGVTIYELVTGHLPFESEDALELVKRIRRDPAPAPSTFVAGLPPELDAIIARCLAKKPAERYAGAKDLLAALDELDRTIPHEGASSVSPPGPVPVPPPLEAAPAPHAAAVAPAAAPAPAHAPARAGGRPSALASLAGAFAAGMGLAGTLGAFGLARLGHASLAEVLGLSAAAVWAAGTLALARGALARLAAPEAPAVLAPAAASAHLAGQAAALAPAAPAAGAPGAAPAAAPAASAPRPPRRRAGTSAVASYGWALSQPTVAARPVPSDSDAAAWRHRPFEPGAEGESGEATVPPASAPQPGPTPAEPPPGYVPAKTRVASAEDLRRAIRT